MYDILQAFKKNLEAPSVIKTNRIPFHTPSKAMCYSAVDNKPIGACLRSAYMHLKKYPVSNPLGIYTIMTAQAGLIWEKWVINQFKELGIYVDHSIKIMDLENKLSGELDILHINPETNDLEVTEVKQYNGSNYGASTELVGNKNKKPKPKDSHLLQVFLYLLMLKNTNNDFIKICNILYIDRSCGSFTNNTQFKITLHFNEEQQVYNPVVEYFLTDGTVSSYIDIRINDKVIFEKNNLLDTFVEKDILPPQDYELKYSDSKIKTLVASKDISATKYNKYVLDPVNNYIGDWMCAYCAFGPNKDGFSTCWSVTND